jgi:hypothetical protein
MIQEREILTDAYYSNSSKSYDVVKIENDHISNKVEGREVSVIESPRPKYWYSMKGMCQNRFFKSNFCTSDAIR